MTGARVRVPRGPIAFGGWRGRLDVTGDVLHVVGDDPADRLDIDVSRVKRCSFNGNNGLWVFRMQDGPKHYVQTSGWILSADRSPAGQEVNDAIVGLLRKHRVRHLGV